MIKAQEIVRSECMLGESPVWDIEDDRIVWIDIQKRRIHHFRPSADDHQFFSIDKIPGNISFGSDGKLFMSVEDGFAILNLDDAIFEMIAEIESEIEDNRFNDGKCDAMGRYWSGSMSMSGKTGGAKLYAMEKDGTVSLKINGLSCCNGLAWSPDSTKFYFIDTPTLQIVSYDFNLQSGEIKNKKIVKTVAKNDGKPDGMTVDNEGMLWVALWGGGRVIRIDPENGDVLDYVDVPVSQVTSCVFGGEKRDDLYITTASTGMTESELSQQPMAGSLFVVRNSGFYGVNT